MNCVCGEKIELHDLQCIINQNISTYKCSKCKRLIKYDAYTVKVSEYKDDDREDKNQKLDKGKYRSL
jgi:hypothetical protein